MRYERNLPKRPMDPGRFRHVGQLQSLSVAAASDGEPVGTWTTYASARFALDTQGGREFWSARQTNSEVTHQLTTWRRTDVLPSHRVAISGRTFEVLYVNNGEEHLRNTYLFCREVNASVA